jgi:HSP20 family molecular chaperone IbpA
MAVGDRRFWAIVNTLLLLGIVVLLATLIVSRRHAAAMAAEDATLIRKASTPRKPPTVRREVDAGRVGVRPVTFTQPAAMSDISEGLRQRGSHPQDWGPLPASPGMDMAETPQGFLLAFSLPGVRGEDVRLTLTDRVVTVQALVRDPDGNQVGGMERRVLLPRAAGSAAEFKALFTNGILRVCVPK